MISTKASRNFSHLRNAIGVSTNLRNVILSLEEEMSAINEKEEKLRIFLGGPDRLIMTSEVLRFLADKND